MLDLIPSLGGWRPAVSGQRCAVATIVAAGGSVPRPLGTSMLVSEHGDVLGSLSGGCVEGAVVDAALEVMRDGGSRLEYVRLQCRGRVRRRTLLRRRAGSPHPAARRPAGRATWRPCAASRTQTPGAPLALIRRLDAGGGAVVVRTETPVRFRAMELAGTRHLLVGDHPATVSRQPPSSSRCSRRPCGPYPACTSGGCTGGSGAETTPNPSRCSWKAGSPRRACWSSAPTTSAPRCCRPGSCWATDVTLVRCPAGFLRTRAASSPPTRWSPTGRTVTLPQKQPRAAWTAAPWCAC